MRQTLHLLAVDHNRRALVAWYARRWMLPILDIAERVRAPLVALDWLAERGLTGDVAGQWLGRPQATNDALDWLLVISIRNVRPTISPSPLQWSSLASLVSSTPVVEYQGAALKAIAPTGDAPVATGPFADTTWPDELRHWGRNILGLSPSSELSMVPHRTSAYELVLEWRTMRGRFFLKGLSADRSTEVSLTKLMYERAPDSFARTITSHRRVDGSVWWLMEACPGQTLTEKVTAAVSADVAVAYARVQQEIGSDETVRSLLQPVDISALERWTTELVAAAGDSSAVDRCALAIREAWECIERTGVAWTWVACDLDPSNTIVHGREVRFIDLDDSVVGPAPLAISTFARRIRRISPESVGDLHHAYAKTWQPALVVGERWSKFDCISRLLECHLGWQRMCLKSERGEIHGLLDDARESIVRKIIKACTTSAGIAS